MGVQSLHSISIPAAPGGRTLWLAGGISFMRSPRIWPAHVPLSPHDQCISILRWKVPGIPLHSETGQDSWSPYSLSSLALLPRPRPGRAVAPPAAEEEGGPGLPPVPTPTGPIPRSVLLGTVGWVTLQRQQPRSRCSTSLPATRARSPSAWNREGGVLPVSLAKSVWNSHLGPGQRLASPPTLRGTELPS